VGGGGRAGALPLRPLFWKTEFVNSLFCEFGYFPPSPGGGFFASLTQRLRMTAVTENGKQNAENGKRNL